MLLSHWRLLPGEPAPPEPEHADPGATVACWHGAEGVARRLAAVRVSATALLLAPVVWMHQQGLFPFDSHLANLLADARQVLVTDFCLATAYDFALDNSERRFLDQQRTTTARCPLPATGLSTLPELTVGTTTCCVAAMQFPPYLVVAPVRWKAQTRQSPDHGEARSS